MNKSMPIAVDNMVKLLPFIVDPAKVCQLCKDSSKCSSCVFGSPPIAQETTPLAALI
jgi:hypothetical protein